MEKESKEFKDGYKQCLEDIRTRLNKFLEDVESDEYPYVANKINPLIIEKRSKSFTVNDIVNGLVFKR